MIGICSASGAPSYDPLFEERLAQALILRVRAKRARAVAERLYAMAEFRSCSNLTYDRIMRRAMRAEDIADAARSAADQLVVD